MRVNIALAAAHSRRQPVVYVLARNHAVQVFQQNQQNIKIHLPHPQLGAISAHGSAGGADFNIPEHPGALLPDFRADAFPDCLAEGSVLKGIQYPAAGILQVPSCRTPFPGGIRQKDYRETNGNHQKYILFHLLQRFPVRQNQYYTVVPAAVFPQKAFQAASAQSFPESVSLSLFSHFFILYSIYNCQCAHGATSCRYKYMMLPDCSAQAVLPGFAPCIPAILASSIKQKAKPNLNADCKFVDSL
ncbi:hypothetical protein BRYFOR_09747 [Marvinbryantia formatexigens DSM 14469]|uniref:Uncharacterized protein n=1 Tax=Marvinbryantia formatexigens DSM 14469 TaxID=478749 RepID=C6LM48_9FIRM|nr:hypothetical protein BRYFOR_09747 [Marvinbryantia formatexigens DSM 14469]